MSRTIFRQLCGTRLYGMAHQTSGYDIIEIYLEDNISKIFGLSEVQSSSTCDYRKKNYELRFFADMVKDGQFLALDVLYGKPSLNENFKLFNLLFRNDKTIHKLIDSGKIYTRVSNFLRSTKSKIIGDDPKTPEQYDYSKYGYRPKLYSHYIRLACSAMHLFTKGFWPAEFSVHCAGTVDQLKKVRTFPEKTALSVIERDLEKIPQLLKQTYETRQYEYHLDYDYLEYAVFRMYLKTLKNYHSSNKNRYDKLVLGDSVITPQTQLELVTA